VIVENAGFGATAAAPIARRVFDYWLLGNWPSAEDIAATQRGQSTVPMGVPRAASSIAIDELRSFVDGSSTPSIPSSEQP
jgi:penicillin-binding protein 2